MCNVVFRFKILLKIVIAKDKNNKDATSERKVLNILVIENN